MDHDTITNEEQHFVGSKDFADVRDGSCQLRTCPNMRCLKTRTGKTECVKEKWNQTECNTILLDACIFGDLARVKNILSGGRADINSVGKGGMTPVMYAAKEGHREVFDVLVREGANLSLLAYRDRNILHLACVSGNVEIVKYVLTHNIVSINSRDEDRVTPAMKAALYKRKAVFDLLVEEGANLFLENEFGQTILHVACVGANVEIVKYLLKHNIVDIDSRDINGWTPVMQAASDGRKDVLDVLVEAGADLSQENNDRETTFNLACKRENVEIIKNLMKHDIVNIDSLDEDGLTPVMHAAIDAKKDVFHVLVEGGADLSILDENNNNILHLACDHNSVEIVKQLLTHKLVDINSKDGHDCTPAMIAARKGHEAVFFVLVEHGADLTVTNYVGDNILNLACEGENAHIVKYVSTQHIVEGSYRGNNLC